MSRNYVELSKKRLSKTIGERIKALRKRQGVSQAELARLCEKSSQQIELIENGKVSPNIFSLYTIAVALDITLADLLDFEILQHRRP